MAERWLNALNQEMVLTAELETQNIICQCIKRLLIMLAGDGYRN